MKNIIFSNYYDSEKEKAIREFLLEDRGEDNGWETIDDIPNSEVWEEMSFNEQIEWEDVKSELENFFDDEEILVIGSVGRWDGTYSAGKVISYDQLWKCWDGCDSMEIYDEDGHMYINASHHDGNNHFEVKLLTEEGIKYYSRWNENWNDSRSEREIHKRLAESSCYTHIPHFAREVYGCKTR